MSVIFINSYMGSVVGPELAYKGHGYVYKDAGPSDTTMNYGTVTAGSAPTDGDLVVWIWLIGVEFYSGSLDGRRIDLTGDGWEQENLPAIIDATNQERPYYVSVLAKVVSTSDIVSPPIFQPGLAANLAANYGMWVAYSVSGTVSAIAIPSATREYASNSAPPNVSVDSSSLAPSTAAITFALVTGTDGSIQLTGITLDKELSQANLGEYYTGAMDIRVGVKLDLGGAAYTLSKGDDGAGNMLVGGYVSVS